MTLIQDNAKVLFLGDGTTDHGRDRENPNDLGGGYAMMSAGWFSLLHPPKRATFFNRGLAGDRVKDLLQRLETDCFALAPTCVSIIIGVNNTRRRYDRNDPTPIEDFEQDYRAVLQQIQDRLHPQLIVGEPFMLALTAEQQSWRADLEEKIEVVRQLSREFDAIHLPLDTIFAEAAKQNEPAYWLFDGVLLTPAGAALIAQTWLKAVAAI